MTDKSAGLGIILGFAARPTHHVHEFTQLYGVWICGGCGGQADWWMSSVCEHCALLDANQRPPMHMVLKPLSHTRPQK